MIQYSPTYQFDGPVARQRDDSSGGIPPVGSFDEPHTQIFMPALGRYLLQYFPVFLLGSIFGKLMSDSGAAAVIGHSVAQRIGAKRSVLAVVLA